MTTINRSPMALLAAGILGLAAAMPVAASDSVSVSVTANVVGVCKFFGSDYEMNIANDGTNIDPSSSTTATGSVVIEYRCSNGTAPTFTIPGTVPLTGAGSMDVTITSSNEGAGTGMGSGQAKDLTINGEIAEADFQNKPVGSYSGTLLVSVNP